MASELQIGEARIDARLIGPQEVAGPLDARLRGLLTERVLPAVATGDSPTDDARVICLPRLPVRISLTLAEVMAGQGAEAWAAAIEDALARSEAEGQVWAFENHAAFLAAYIRQRFGLGDVPESVFSGLGAMAHAAPAQVMAELLRADTAIWDWLAPDGAADAQAFVAQVLAQVPRDAWAALGVLAISGRDGDGGEDGAAAVTAPIRAAAARLTPGITAGLARGYAKGGLPAAAFHGRLLCVTALGEEHPGRATALSFAVAAAMGAAARGRQTGEALDGTLLQMIAQTPAPFRPLAEAHASAIRQDEDAFAAFRQLVAAVGAAGDVAASQSSRADNTTAKASGISAPEKTSGAPAPVTAPAAQISTDREATPDEEPHTTAIATPFAGIGLCLPFLTENHIGAAFPAEARLSALEALCGIRRGTGPADPALCALAGEDMRPVPASDRPNRTDLLFVPQDQHAVINAAPPGPPRLAAWVMARFAASLPGLAASSNTYLKAQFLQRPGSVMIDEDAVTITIQRMPLALVIDMAGLLEPGRWHIGWLEGRALRLILREAAP